MNRLERIAWLRQGNPRIAPSLLACNFVRLESELQALDNGGAEVLHLDVMDGHFVPNLTYGPLIIKNIRDHSSLVLDAHLMISNPSQYLGEFIDAGCDIVTIHLESTSDPGPLMMELRKQGIIAGLSIKPDTPVEMIFPWLDQCDLVLIMSVEPGFGGQTFQDNALEKLRILRKRGPENLLLEVDGAIKRHNITIVGQTGCDLIVAGTAIFQASDYGEEIKHLSRLSQTPDIAQTSK